MFGRTFFLCVLIIGIAPSLVQSQAAKSTPSSPAVPISANEAKGTYLGVLFAPLPEVLYAQLPTLKPGESVLVTLVLPDSPADQAGLKRHDIVLSYANTSLRDCEHFAKLIREDKPQQKVALRVLRAGKEQEIAVTLGLGPILEISLAGKTNKDSEIVKSAIKPSDPSGLSVSVKPIDGGLLKVTVEYYQDNSGKLQTLQCTGSASEIALEMTKLPARLQPKAKAALQRLEAYSQPTSKPAR